MPIARTLGNCLSAANYARLVDLVGPARTKDLLFTGRFLDAAEASLLGLVTATAEPDRIDEAVAALAGRIAAHALTIRATKEAVRRIAEHRRVAAGLADDLVAACYASADFREGIEAFLAKRRRSSSASDESYPEAHRMNLAGHLRRRAGARRRRAA